MNNRLYILLFLSILVVPSSIFSQSKILLTDEIAVRLSELPLKCIGNEYPNKTAHVINDSLEAHYLPQELHPVFYGCFDWHSSVHGHWMLVKLLKTNLTLSNNKRIIDMLDYSLDADKLQEEANYFSKFKSAESFERTYGWAWLLKLDEELATWDSPLAKKWHENLQPLTKQIVNLWKKYLPKQTYPNRTGVHPNSAFALGFAIDWARCVKDTDFELQLVEKSKQFYLADKNTPAYLEPDGTDFFSPSLEIADLMRRVISPTEYHKWIRKFYTEKSIENVCQIPDVSDINDFQIVHLIGLSFSKAWCMKNISKQLPKGSSLSRRFYAASEQLLDKALPYVFEGNYGGEHWLASFAIMAME